jgi:hypothetical protein
MSFVSTTSANTDRALDDAYPSSMVDMLSNTELKDVSAQLMHHCSRCDIDFSDLGTKELSTYALCSS